MMEAHRFYSRVYAEDTDFMGIVYHSCYLNFFERARSELLREKGLSLPTLAQYDCHFVIHEAKLSYVRPAKLNDYLSIETTYTKKSACRLEFTQQMYNEAKQLLAEVLISVVAVDKLFKPRRLPEQFELKLNK